MNALRSALVGIIGPLPVGKAAAGPGKPVDVDAIVGEVMRRIPLTSGGMTIVVQPAEALRKEFQQREVDRVLEYIAGLDPRVRDAVRLLEATDKWLSFSAIATRLGISQGDGSMKLNKALKKAADDGYVEIKERAGLHAGLRAKLATDLATYDPSPEDVEQTYASCMAILAGASAAAA